MMKLIIAALCVLVLVQAAPEATFRDFQVWTHRFNKTYDTSTELLLRFENFKASVERIEKRRAEHFAATGEPGDKVYGLTKFADMSPEEFKGTFLGFRGLGPQSDIAVAMPSTRAAADKVDWREKGVVTPVKNQEQCGSCWAFSATEEIESAWAFQGNTLTELSVQQIVSCDNRDAGCNGGDTLTAYQYVKAAGGLEKQSEYPYTSGTGNSGQCKVRTSDEIISVSNHSFATPPCYNSCDNQNENILAENLASRGPVSICVNAMPWQDYNQGVMKTGCSHGYGDLDHCVQLVGYDKTKTEENVDYWMVRNSWGTDWGYSGYIRIEMGKNLCGVADEATLVHAVKATKA